MIRQWTRHRASVPGGAFFESGELRAIPVIEDGRWHMSISCASGRYPTWDEIADARYDLMPAEKDFVLVLPPKRDYVNIGNVFHLHENRDAGLHIDRGVAFARTHENGIAP